MKKLYLALLACATLGNSFHAAAETHHTVSLGYAQSERVKDEGNPFTPKGVNVKYRYEWDSPVSVISSLTYLSSKTSSQTATFSYIDINNAHTKLFNFSVGPAYRFNEFVSLYGLVGMNYTQIKSQGYEQNRQDKTLTHSYHDSEKSANMLFGAGLQFNPRQDMAIDIGYEGIRYKATGEKSNILNTFNIGIGYRF
ncbi:Ail/Lom family outer membrane beta-barrel protein [Martelella alba]|uniref:Ail/Lom family protein n=1 Tax=Martelella alba TaxID=2590451 RepID=A0ABY2SL00_9HYPH|nr:Ail/Lom family outer membrane beta-barrel protein [Martelella alba]TKI06146.1 Ail/Lom family protein [Martelella alba]